MNPALPLAEKLLQQAIEKQASDIHFYPYSSVTKIFLRIHGERKLFQRIPIQKYENLITYFKFTSGMDIGESKKPQNGSMTFRATSNHVFSLRLSTLPLTELESLAIRILPQSNLPGLEQLFLFPKQINILERWVQQRSGLILVTGPTGSGKTSTLYALLQKLIQEQSVQTITLEDPVEKKIDNILQMQINEKAGVTYYTGLKAALRHDPDIIMIGEIRDQKTAEFAFHASLTGHLVLSTLHAKSALGTIDRLLEMGITEQDMLQSLIAVAAIELLPIKLQTEITRRAAILEPLDGQSLIHAIKKEMFHHLSHQQTFEHLRRKAYAYGFIDETIFHKTSKKTYG